MQIDDWGGGRRKGDKNERRSEKRLLVKIVRDYVKEKYRILQSEVYIKFQEGSYLNCLMFL